MSAVRGMMEKRLRHAEITTSRGITSVEFPLYSENPRGGHPTPRPGTQDFKEVRMNDVDTIGGYAVPVDPMDDLQCESCQ
jgi:hypothetical protein